MSNLELHTLLHMWSDFQKIIYYVQYPFTIYVAF